MLNYVNIVKINLVAIDLYGKVRLVNLRSGTLGKRDSHGIALLHGHKRPFAETRENLIDIILRPVDAGSDKLPTATCDLPF